MEEDSYQFTPSANTHNESISMEVKASENKVEQKPMVFILYYSIIQSYH